MKKLIGRKKFASLREVFFEIKDGKPIPKYNYTFHVDTEKIASAVTYIDLTLQVRPGQCRSVRLGSHLFCNLPIYDIGGENVRILHAAYATLFETAIGFKKFQDVVKLLTKHGKTKAGLSTYYIWFRSLSQVFEGMLRRLAKMP